MQATWSDTDFEESDSMTFEDVRYEQNDYFALVASIDFMHDSDSECKCTNGQNATFLDNLVVQYQNLITKYLKKILDAHKAKIELLNEEKTNYLEKKFDFLSLNIIIFLRETMLSLKRLKKLNCYNPFRVGYSLRGLT